MNNSSLLFQGLGNSKGKASLQSWSYLAGVAQLLCSRTVSWDYAEGSGGYRTCDSSVWCTLAMCLGPESGGEDAAANAAESLSRGACF